MALRGRSSGVQCPLGCVVTSGRVAPGRGPTRLQEGRRPGQKICLSTGKAQKSEISEIGRGSPLVFWCENRVFGEFFDKI